MKLIGTKNRMERECQEQQRYHEEERDRPASERKIADAASVPVTVSVKSDISLSLFLHLVRSPSNIYFSYNNTCVLELMQVNCYSL